MLMLRRERAVMVMVGIGMVGRTILRGMGNSSGGSCSDGWQERKHLTSS